jgi:surface protein
MMLRSFFLVSCLALATMTVAATRSHHLRSSSSNNKNVRSYLRCNDEQYSCGPDGRVHMCHYNGVEFTTLCVRSRSSIVEHLHPVDYCGQCMDAATAVGVDKKAFESLEELQAAVDWYVSVDPATRKTAHKALAAEYGYPIGQWNVRKITSFRELFAKKVHFNEDISQWNMSSATDLSYMFWHAHSFAGSLEQWDVSNVQTMERMFFGAERFNSDIGQWKTHSLTNLMGTFWRATEFNADISTWNTSQVTMMSRCFSDATAFDQDLSSWNTSNVLDMSFMFLNAQQFQKDLGAWNVQRVVTFERMFAKVPHYQQSTVQLQLLRQWNMNQDAIVHEMFTGGSNVKSLRAQQQLEANIQVDAQTLMRLVAGQQQQLNATSDANNHEPDVALSTEILCHGGVCM